MRTITPADMGTEPWHVVGLSGGKDSTAMALRLREVNPTVPYRFVITPTGNELPEMNAHWALLEDLLGEDLLRVPNRGLEDLMEAQEMLPSTLRRWCTRMVKVVPVVALYARLPRGSGAYVGLRADEPTREGIYGSSVIQRFPLREWGWGLSEVLGYLERLGVKVPRRTDCAWCPFQSADDWFQLWRDHPTVYAQAEAWEEKLQHTFRSPTAKLGTWAVSLKDMRAQFESGKITREERKRLRQIAEGDEPEEACRVCRM